MVDSTYTALVLIVDRSGSMDNISKQTQDALEELVNGQKEEPGKLTIDTVFFDNHYDERAHFVDPKLTKLDLAIRPGGMTALYDAIGNKVTSFGEALEALPEDERPGKVIVVIATDGMENSSHKYNADAVATLIKNQKEEYDWKFTFIAANQDAVLTAQTLNINSEDAITFSANNAGTQSVLRSVSNYISTARVGGQASYTNQDRLAALSVPQDPSVDPLGSNITPTSSRGGGAAASHSPRPYTDPVSGELVCKPEDILAKPLKPAGVAVKKTTGKGKSPKAVK